MPTSPQPKPTVTHPRLARRAKWILLTLAIVSAIMVALFIDVKGAFLSALNWIERLGPFGPALFILIYALATVLFLPGFILTLGAGAVFGVVKGSITVSIASTLGATGAFVVGRYLARDAIAQKIAGNARFAAVDRAVAQEGWKIVGLTRLSPMIPFNLLNYAFGLTRVRLWHYVLASWIGMLPGTVMYVYVGSLATDLATLEENAPPSFMKWVGLAITIAVTIYITLVAKKALESRVQNHG